MKILAVSDDECRRFYECYEPGNLDGFDLILSCGDLPAVYLEFLTTMSSCPVVYVRGNHDDHLLEHPPGGCICAEDRVIRVNGLRIAGLGGSNRYKPDGRNMFTEREMTRRYRRMLPSIIWKGGVDILLTHAPARGLGDFDSVSHRGFEVFLRILERYHPAYMVHGHIHKNYGIRIPRRMQYNGTTIINAYESCVFEIDEKDR